MFGACFPVAAQDAQLLESQLAKGFRFRVLEHAANQSTIPTVAFFLEPSVNLNTKDCYIG